VKSLSRIALLAVAVATAASLGIAGLLRSFADTKPNVQLNVDNAGPRQIEDNTQRSIVRDYTAAWQGIRAAFEQNSTAPLNENFTGFALDRLSQRVKEQQSNGLKTRIVDHGHKVEAIFYSIDGSAIQLRDTASIETQILDGTTVIHSDQAQIHYIAIMTGAEDRWKVRVLQSVEGE
jgi:hypothetical protein